MRLVPSFLVLALSLVGVTSSAQQLVGPFSKGSYPTEPPLRPLTLPFGTVQADLDLGYSHVSGDTLFFSATAALVSPGIAYGVTDNLEVGARILGLGTTSSFRDEWSLELVPTVSADYSLLDSVALDVAGRVSLGYAMDAESAVFSFGLPLRYAFGDRLAVRAADTLVSAASGGGFTMTLPVALQAQLLPILGLELATTLLTVSKEFGDFEPSGPQTVALGLVATPLPNFDLRLGTAFPFPGSDTTGGLVVTGGVAQRF